MERKYCLDRSAWPRGGNIKTKVLEKWDFPVSVCRFLTTLAFSDKNSGEIFTLKDEDIQSPFAALCYKDKWNGKFNELEIDNILSILAAKGYVSYDNDVINVKFDVIKGSKE